MDFFTSNNDRTSTYAVTDDVSDEEYDAVLEEAKAEGNLSRANVVRKVKNLPTFSEAQAEKWQQIADLANDRLTSSQIAKRVGMILAKPGSAGSEADASAQLPYETRGTQWLPTTTSP